VTHDLDGRVDRAEVLERRVDLGSTDVCVRVKDLALEVRDVDGIEVDDPIVPTPAAARYIAIGEPSPPAPMMSTLESRSLR